MNRITRAAAGLAALMLVAFASLPAAADNYTFKDAYGGIQTSCAKAVSSLLYSCQLMYGLGLDGNPQAFKVPLQTFNQYAASGITPVTGALASSTRTAAFQPAAGRTFYLELTGTGAVTGTVVYLCNDGSTYAPNVVATDGSVPTVMDKIAYNGGVLNGVRIALSVDQAGMTVKFSPGTVTGTVNYAFVQ